MASSGDSGAKREDRNATISENLQKLIRKLSGPEASARELQQSEQMAWKTIRKHRYLSPNSHEVGRSLDALVERLRVEGMAEFGNTIRDLSAKMLQQPEWRDHQTQDVQWSVLDFLLSSTNEPIQNIRRNRVPMNQHRLAVIAALKEAEGSSKEAGNAPINAADTEVDWAALLSEDFLQPASDQLGDSSDSLSEWSDENDASATETLTGERDTTGPDIAAVYEQAMQGAIPCSTTGTATATYHRPPEEPPKGCHFSIAQPVVFTVRERQTTGLRKSKMPQLAPPLPPIAASQYEESVRDEDLLPRTIHAHWWRDKLKVFALPSDADPLDNFAVSYVQFVNHKTLGLMDLPLPNTTTEPCLLREILFMFVRPASCCFFDFDRRTRRIGVRRNVSICTVTADTLRGFLEANVVPALEDMLDLRRIIDEHTLFLDEAGTGTLECFAHGLRDLVQPISQLLVDYEERVVGHQAEATLIDFMSKFKDHFRQLHLLRCLAQDALLGEGPQHLRSAYLLSRLYGQTRARVPHQKLATALLLVSLKRYCSIIDAWWRRATLEDRQNEFIVERCGQEDSAEWSSYVRKRSVPPEASPRVRQSFKQLRQCPFYKILLDHALESGDTQDLLANVNLLGEMLATSNESQPRSLYDELAAQLFAQLGVYCQGVGLREEAEEQAESEEPGPGQTADQQLLSSLQGIQNSDLLHIFTRPARERLMERQHHKPNVQVRAILDRLERSTCLQLKAELPEALREILLRRQGLANEYAMRAYREDLQLGENLRFLRHVMMLEAYHLLFPYYNALFRRIETLPGWARESLLSSELYEVLVPAYPQLAGNLHVQVLSQAACAGGSHIVYEALEALELVYDMPAALQRILTERHIQGYNAVWRLMLKLKWAVWKLENLSFLRRPKTEPYAPLDLLGLTIRRLEMTRFWLIYLINSLHTHVMGALAEQFELRIGRCRNLRELSAQHDAYVAMLLKHCLLTDDFASFREALEHLFYLVFVLHSEWNDCRRDLSNNDALSLSLSLAPTEDGDDSAEQANSGHRDELDRHNYVAEIETTYILCHQKLGVILNTLVYEQDHGFLTALAVAISNSCPC